MTISEFFKRIYPHINVDIFYPNRKNSGIFLSLCFQAAGSSYFSLAKGREVKSEDVSLQRKIFDGSRKMTYAVKSSFHSFNVSGVTSFLEQSIVSGKINEIMLAFGVPVTATINEKAFCNALALQMKSFIDADAEDVEDIVLLEYQRLIAEPTEDVTPSEITKVLYPGDSVYVESAWRPVYSVACNEKFQHTWSFQNSGTQTWRGRKLFFSNHDSVRPRADTNYIEIPDTPPGKNIKITASMDARGFEGKTECLWIMVDSEGNSCFPNSSFFTIIIDVTFRFG